MNGTGFKNVIQKLGIFKDYSSLLMAVVIFLVAVLIFVVSLLMGGKVREKVADESVSMGKRVRSLSSSAVARGQGEVERAYQDVYAEDANRIALLSKQSTQRQLLSYRIFPEPKDTSVLIFEEFGQRFLDAVDGLIKGVNARDCPTDGELDSALKSSSPSRSRRVSRGRARRRSFRRGNEVDAAIVNVLCQHKAKNASVYANPSDLDGYEFWKVYEFTGRDKAVKACWYYQLAYWIIEDVIDTISALNSGSNSVLTSSVKRLMTISFTEKGGMSRARRGAGDSKVDDRPGYILSIEDGLTESCTGRVSNDDIDVVHFNVILVISAKGILPFMEELCGAKQHTFRGFWGQGQQQVFKHNQITILESNIESIDREDQEHEFYRYGEDGVIKLDLICEYIFNKKGYAEIKPELVKKSLGGSEKK